MTIPLTVTFESGFDPSIPGTTQEAIAVGAQAAWTQWLRFLHVEQFAPAAVFEVQIGTSVHTDSAQISVGLVGSRTQLHHELATGVDTNGTTPDAVVTLGPNFRIPIGGPEAIFAHEFGHALGFVAGDSAFAQLTQGAYFTGSNAVAEYGGPVPILQDGFNNHIANPAVSVMGGNSLSVALLDAAILADLGYPVRLDGTGNSNPIAVDDNFIVSPGSVVVIRLTDNDLDADGDSLESSLTSFPNAGGIANNQNGTYTLQAADQAMSYSFEYEVRDGVGGSDTGLVTVSVGGDGTGADEKIIGANASETLRGNGGADWMTGLAGADVIYGNTGADRIYGNQGTDTLFGGQDADAIFGGQEVDVLYGNVADDVLYGNLANDTIYGGQGDDTIYGGQGDDVLFGNIGNDLILPNLGADTVQPGGGGADTVIGFDGAAGDRLALASLPWSLGSSAAGEAVLSYGDGSITLIGVAAGSFRADWLV